MLEILEFPWERHHWFSSGLSDQDAQQNRGAVCSRPDPDGMFSHEWLRKLHRSHENGPGPFSICVHREDVRSLSYSEIYYSDGRLELETFAGPPCKSFALSIPSFQTR